MGTGFVDTKYLLQGTSHAAARGRSGGREQAHRGGAAQGLSCVMFSESVALQGGQHAAARGGSGGRKQAHGGGAGGRPRVQLGLQRGAPHRRGHEGGPYFPSLWLFYTAGAIILRFVPALLPSSLVHAIQLRGERLAIGLENCAVLVSPAALQCVLL